jgi:hypothetical protein
MILFLFGVDSGCCPLILDSYVFITTCKYDFFYDFSNFGLESPSGIRISTIEGG